MKHTNKPDTEEEYEELKRTILKMSQDGIPVRRMQAQLNLSYSYIKKIRQLLISEGLITEKEIKEAFDAYMKENPPAQGLDKSRVRKEKDTKKAEIKHNNSIENKEKVLELLKQGKTRADVSYELKISGVTVKRYIDILVEEGKIKEEEIKKSSTYTGRELIDRTDEKYLTQIYEIVWYLKLGWKYDNIRRKLDISTYDFNIYLRDIKYKKLLTSEEIKEARRIKREDDLKFVAEHIQQGFSLQQIRDLKPEFAHNEITPMVKELIDAGIITQEQVNKNTKEGKKATANKKYEMSVDMQLQYIIDKVREGFSPQEIVDSDETKTLTLHKVQYQKRQIIANGIISQEDADNAMNKRKAKKLARKHDETIETIKKHIMQGFKLKEISELMNYSYPYLSEIIRDYSKQNGWFSKEELKEFARQRKIRESGDLPEEEETITETAKTQEEEKQENERIQKEDDENAKTDEMRRHKEKTIETIKEYTMQGYNLKEIMRLIDYPYSYSSFFRLRAEYINQNGWFSEKELEEFARQRQIREFESLPKEEKARIITAKKQERERQEAERIQKETEAKAKKDEKKRQQEEKYRKLVERMKEYHKSGLSMTEIAKELNCSIAYVYKLKKWAIENNLWIVEEEIQPSENENKKKEKSESPELNDAIRIAEEAKKEVERLKKIVDELTERIKKLESAQKGINVEGTKNAEESKHQEYEAKKEEERKHQEEETKKEEERKRRLDAYKKKREITRKEEEERIARMERAEARQQKMNQEKEENARREKEKIEREKKEKYERELAEIRAKIAEQERKKMAQQQGPQEIPIWKRIQETKKDLTRLKSRIVALIYSDDDSKKEELARSSKVFIDTLSKLRDFDAKIDNGDIDITISIYKTNPELIDTRSIKYLIANGYRNDGVYGFKKVTDSLEKALVGTKYHDAIVQYIQAINKSNALSKINETKRDKMDIAVIAQQLGLKSTDDSFDENRE